MNPENKNEHSFVMENHKLGEYFGRKPRVAILLVGLTRKFREASPSLFQYLIEPFREFIDFDFFLYTWNITGDYNYELKDFSKELKDNWIVRDPISLNDINDLKKIYQPVSFQIEDYLSWEQKIQPELNDFLSKHHCNDEPIRVFNGIFAQYYQVMKGFQILEKYQTEKQINYDLIIRTRFDWQIINPPIIRWTMLFKVAQHQIIGLEKWDMNGVRGNWIAGNYHLMKQYSQLYNYLPLFTIRDIRKCKLGSIIVPLYVFNYAFKDDTEIENISNQDIYQFVFDRFSKQVNNFISSPNRLRFRCSLIPELLLKYYLEQICGLHVYLEEFIYGKVYEGQKSQII